jgi:hypothetical protein
MPNKTRSQLPIDTTAHTNYYQIMNKKDKDEVHKIVADAVHEVVIPALEDMEERLASKQDIDRLERKLDAHTKRMDRHGKQLENHEGRIQILETASI